MRVRGRAAFLLVAIDAACGLAGCGDGPADPDQGQHQVPAITSIAPDTLIEGATGTITGTGFLSGGTTVTIDDVPATVTATTSTTITFEVPPSDCRPARVAKVRATVGAGSSLAHDQPSRPSGYTGLAVGKQVLFRTPAEFCVQLDRAADAEAYLVGVQSVSEEPSDVTSIVVSGQGEEAAAMSPALVPKRGTHAEPLAMSAAKRLAAHRRAEVSLREAERRVMPPLAQARMGRRTFARALHILPRVGDTLSFKVPALANLCFQFTTVNAVVRLVGNRGIWLNDVANPVGYSTNDFRALSYAFDAKVYTADTVEFGGPTDADMNGRIFILVTHVVNQESAGLLGFVSSTDFFPADPDLGCASSNEGEIFYARAPDPNNDLGGTVYTVANGIADVPMLVGHELTHIIQYGRRLANPASSFPTIWEAEGQATLAEEIIGHAFENHAPRENLGADVAFDALHTAAGDWYRDRFVDLANYFGWDPPNVEPFLNAPEQCTWLAVPPNGICNGLRAPYGVGWSFLRWLTDRYAATYPAGEPGFQSALIDANGSGFATIEEVTGAPIDSLLAQWAASLYVDDIGVEDLDPQLAFPSWNLHDVLGVDIGGGSPLARLTPIERPIGAFADDRAVRAASTAYTRVSSAGAHGPASIKARGPDGALLPESMRMWVVRLR